MIKNTQTKYLLMGLGAIAVVIFAVYFIKANKSKTIDNPKTFTTTATTVSKQVQYKNTKYGFSFDLPGSWRGYTIVNDEWDGYSISNDISQQNNTETGPLIFIRNPIWTEDVQTQDIPIMVFTIDQWNKLQNDDFHIGAAPIGPSELSRNSKYVFALPARYNFSYLKGFEEVEKILENKPLKAF